MQMSRNQALALFAIVAVGIAIYIGIKYRATLNVGGTNGSATESTESATT